MTTQVNVDGYPDLPHYVWLQEQLQQVPPDLAELLQDSCDWAEACNRAWHHILRSCQGNLVGTELKMRGAAKYAAVLADPSEPGRFRAQYYDAQGFSGHCAYDTALEVLEALIKEGYRELCNGTLARISLTSEWMIGTTATNLIAEMNEGRISYREMQQRMAEAVAKYT